MTAPHSYPYRPDGWATDIYPMPAFAQLVASDIERSSGWYQDVLGFVDVFTMRGPDAAPLVAHLRWCTFGDLLLVPSRARQSGPVGAGITLYFSADEVDSIVDRAASRSAAPLEGPVDRPWNTREVTFADPDGYRITFAAASAEIRSRAAAGNPVTMDETVERLRSAFRR